MDSTRQITLQPAGLTRREFLACSALGSAVFVTGCAVNPVTGQQQLMLVGAGQEIQIDRQNAPHQFSADYGPVRDAALNNYIDSVGRQLAARSHRTDMPYSFRAVNAAYVNAYAFPGGSIALTRGILLNMESEAEMAALVGHELGHVNARHTAQQMTKGMLTSALITGVAVAVGGDSGSTADIIAGVGGIAAGALLARYSRDNERQADELGMEYMVRAGYSPQGLVDLMEMLRSLQKRSPNALELMFATHPMSAERHDRAVERAASDYSQAANFPLYRERYMDHTASLRARKELIEGIQKAEKEMGRKEFTTARDSLSTALKVDPEDYTGLLIMAKCQIALEAYREAETYADDAHRVYLDEPQALMVRGMARMYNNRYEEAAADFSTYDNILPGNPNATFYGGLALEKAGRRDDAARQYAAYLRKVSQGERARYAYRRLQEWGYLR